MWTCSSPVLPYLSLDSKHFSAPCIFFFPHQHQPLPIHFTSYRGPRKPWDVSFSFVRLRCSLKSPLDNLVLIRTHRSGGSTLANLLYRYGDLNDLEFALPKQRSYDFYWPLHFNPSFVEKKYLNSTPPNLLINARYSPDTMASFMSKVTVNNYYFIILIHGGNNCYYLKKRLIQNCMSRHAMLHHFVIFI